MPKKSKVTIDDLAIMIAKGFTTMEEKFGKQIGGLKKDLVETNVRLDVLEKGQEEILLKLQNVVYRFEFNALDTRVKILERSASKRI